MYSLDNIGIYKYLKKILIYSFIYFHIKSLELAYNILNHYQIPVLSLLYIIIIFSV